MKTYPKIKIIDKDFLSSIDPSKIKNYLIKTGWKLNHNFEYATVWIHNKDNIEFGLILPDKKSADFIIRMCESLEILQDFENRSQLNIIQDIEDKL